LLALSLPPYPLHWAAKDLYYFQQFSPRALTVESCNMDFRVGFGNIGDAKESDFSFCFLWRGNSL